MRACIGGARRELNTKGTKSTKDHEEGLMVGAGDGLSVGVGIRGWGFLVGWYDCGASGRGERLETTEPQRAPRRTEAVG